MNLTKFALLAIFFSLACNRIDAKTFQVAKINYLEHSLGIAAQLNWQQQQHSYQTLLSIDVPFASIVYKSSGNTDEKKMLQPLLFQELINGKLRHAALFDWTNRQISFDNKKTANLGNNAQDLLSLSWQLAFHSADFYTPAAMQLTNGQRIYSYRTSTSYHAKINNICAKVFQANDDDEALEIWISNDKKFANIPLRIILRKKNQLSLDLIASEIELDNKTVWRERVKQIKTPLIETNIGNALCDKIT